MFDFSRLDLLIDRFKVVSSDMFCVLVLIFNLAVSVYTVFSDLIETSKLIWECWLFRLLSRVCGLSFNLTHGCCGSWFWFWICLSLFFSLTFFAQFVILYVFLLS